MVRQPSPLKCAAPAGGGTIGKRSGGWADCFCLLRETRGERIQEMRNPIHFRSGRAPELCLFLILHLRDYLAVLLHYV